jgi:hypothetical protein
MTTASERSSAQSRGRAMAARASASRLRALEDAGLRFDWLDDLTVFVEGQYRFNIAGSSWVHINDPDAHGYLVATLVTDFRKRNSEKPAVGRDSIAKPADSDRAAELTIDSGCDAESAAGPRSQGARSASPLPAVNPWP